MGAEQFGKLNIWAMLRALINAGVGVFPNAGTPSDGTSGTLAGKAGKGSLIVDTTNGKLYQNTNTTASPTWNNVGDITAAEIALAEGNVLVGNASGVGVALNAKTDARVLLGNGTTITSVAVSGDATITNAGAVTVSNNAITSAKMAASLLKVATGTVTAAQIIGTSAGELGHADGVVMVAGGGADVINQLVSCMLINDFDTAAYTDGGNTTVNIGGGAALTGLVSAANFIQSGADKVIEFVPLAATFNTYTLNNSLNLVSASAPTDPGTAAGVFRFHVMYRQITAGL